MGRCWFSDQWRDDRRK